MQLYHFLPRYIVYILRTNMNVFVYKSYRMKSNVGLFGMIELYRAHIQMGRMGNSVHNVHNDNNNNNHRLA